MVGTGWNLEGKCLCVFAVDVVQLVGVCVFQGFPEQQQSEVVRYAACGHVLQFGTEDHLPCNDAVTQ